MIGGISYFHTYAYDLLATNERIIASSCDAAIKAFSDGRLQKVTYMSSSMVFESATDVAVVRGPGARVPAAALVVRVPEARGRVLRARRVRPVRRCRTRSCGRSTASASAKARALGDVEVLSGNVKLAMSHVVPDLVQKV